MDKDCKDKKTKNMSIFEFILDAIEESEYIFAPKNYAFTKPYRALLDWMYEEKKINYRQKYYVKQVLDKMIKDKLVLLAKNGRLQLTEEGKRKLSDLKFKDFAISKPKIWDKKFRVIIFDIAVEKNSIRTALRRQLADWGFIRLQNSVWVTPYECKEVISLLKSHFGVDKNVVYLTVESIENDAWLKKSFGLV